jgi:endonuclease/exonuclease/phosphatase family metal-dependent hydrolase
MKALILVWASIFFAPFAFSQPVQALSAQKIKLLSWNIYMLPGFFGRDNMPRADVIGELLSSGEYDVIIFQEAFHRRARKIIGRMTRSRYPFQAGPANRKVFSMKTHSGIWILSKHPIVDSKEIIFTAHHGVDGLARKGALMVELEVAGQHVQVVGTHLQNSADPVLRHSQCAELYQDLLAESQKPGVAQIICGDFNIDRYRSGDDYAAMLETLDVSDGKLEDDHLFSYDRLNNDLHVEPGTEQDLIDYILFRPNQTGLECRNRRIKAFRQSWHARHMDLSDHFAIEAEVLLRDGGIAAMLQMEGKTQQARAKGLTDSKP